ncbi:cytochrome P450 4V2 [Bemisia tabaci]|uniref:cytochrome P450 4V2 n=1 Tax=Bemisia tabaci TaxID=7038 RepID=UPI003B28990E
MQSYSTIVSSNMTAILLAVVLSVLLITYLIQRWRNRKIHKFMASVPGPVSIPLFGNAYFVLKINSDNLYDVLREQMDKYPNAGYWLGKDPWLITGDIKIFNALLSSNQNTTKTEAYHFFKSHGMGIFCLNGESWRQIRKIVNPSFRTNVLASFGDSFSYHTKTFVERLEKHSGSGCDVDLFVPVHLCTIDFICENMMGCRMDVQKKNLTHISTNLEKSTQMIFTRMFNILLQPDLLYSLLGKQKEIEGLVKDMRALAREMVELRAKHRNDIKNSGDTAEPVQIFMESLLNSVESGALTKERAVDETVEMFIAGSITTATTSAWIFKILAMRPDIQKKVFEEIQETCSLDKQEICLDEVSKLDYLDMVVKETLRHFAVPFVGRQLVEDLKVDETTTIPAGVQVMPVIFSLHHNPEYWQKPKEFYPEHFSPVNERKRVKGAFVPFLSGPRHCPGNKYALQSIKFLVANTLLHYEFSSDEKSPEDFFNADYRILFMMWPSSGFRVKIKKRLVQGLSSLAG